MTEKIGLEAILETTDFEQGVKLYNSGIDAMLAAGDDMSASAKTQLTSLTDLAEVLSDASPAKLATTAINQLQAQFMEGSISAEQYASAVTQVQDEFGLVSPTGKAAAGALTELNRKFQDGEISAEEYAEELTKVELEQEEAGKSAVEMAASLELVEKAYDAIANVIGEAVELAELGAQAERTERQFRAFAGEVGDADELLAAFQAGAGGTVDKMTAMSSAGRLLQMGLVSTNDEMEQVVEIATRLGDQTQSAGDRVSDFALLLANQSIPRLDNFGISSGKVRDRIAELQAAFPGMSREAAFSQAVFEEGAKSLDVLGARVDDAGAAIERGKAKMADMRVEAGQKLLPIVAKLFDVIGNLETGTLALITVLGSGLGVITKFSISMSTIQAHATKANLALGLLGAATIVLIAQIDQLQKTIQEVNASQESAVDSASTMGDQFNELVASGVSVDDALAQIQTQLAGATQAFESSAAAGGIANAVFGTNAAFAETMATAYDSLNIALAAGAPTFESYTESAKEFNRENSDAPARLQELNAELERLQATGLSATEGVGGLASETRAVKEEIAILSQTMADGTGNLALMSEANFELARSLQAGSADAGELTSQFVQQLLGIEQVTTATGEVATAVDQSALAVEDANRKWAAFVSKQEQATNKSEMLSNRMRDQGGDVDAATAVLAEHAQALEWTARNEQAQVDAATAAAAATREKEAADIATTQAEQALAQSVLNASDAMIAQTFISGLDPEAMGLVAYREAVEGIQLAFGLATPESIALARGINQGIDAMNEGSIAANEMDDFIAGLIDSAEGGADAIEGYTAALDENAAASLTAAQKSLLLGNDLAALDSDAATATTALDGATESVTELDAAMSEAAAGAASHGAAIGSNLSGALDGAMSGMINRFRGRIQEMRDILPSSEPKDVTSPLYGLDESGAAIVENLLVGVKSQGANAVNVMAAVGTNMGQAFVDAIGNSAEDLFSAAGVLGGLGGAAGGILQRRTVDPLQSLVDDLSEGLEEASVSFDEATKRGLEIQAMFADMGFGRARGLFIGGNLSQLTEEQISLMEEFDDITRTVSDSLQFTGRNTDRLAKAQSELADQQERLNRLATQQENLRFLEQQAQLLELITEKGLDAKAVLGGLELGLDANVEDVVDAMSSAMELIIAQAEEELGIASPSRVFERIGSEAMQGMALGIQRLMSAPAAQTALATQAMIATPAAIVSPRNTTIDNSRSVGDINITGRGGAGQMSDAQFIAAVQRVVDRSMRGVS